MFAFRFEAVQIGRIQDSPLRHAGRRLSFAIPDENTPLVLAVDFAPALVELIVDGSESRLQNQSGVIAPKEGIGC